MSAGIVERFGAGLGPKLDLSPERLEDPRRAKKVVVTVQQHDLGWLIVAKPDRERKPHSGWFVAAVKRCLIEGCRESDCIGHQAKVRKLAEKIVRTYR